jgi:SAM-dependent methyltransferase
MSLRVIACPLCDQKESFLEVTVPNTDVHIRKYGALYRGSSISAWKVCGRCGFVHQNPRPSIEDLNQFYLQSSYHVEPPRETPEEHLKFARWYYSEKIEYAISKSGLKQGRVFDIGCGLGGVLKLCEERGWDTYGVEPDASLAGFAIENFGLKGVRPGLLDGSFALQEKVDLVFSNHAFEHFADLHEVMTGVRNILKPGGFLFIAIPTYFRNKSRLSKRWMNSSHYSLFTHHSLNNLGSRYGFEEVVHTYSGWKKEIDDLWYLARFTGKVTDSRLHFENPANVSRYLSVINPLRSALFFLFYSNWARRVQIYTRSVNAARLLVESPTAFFRKVRNRMRGRARVD